MLLTNTPQFDQLCHVAEGGDLDVLDEVQRSEMADEILKWAANGLYIFLHSNNSQASFNKTVQWWKQSEHVEQVFRTALPDTYKKVLGFLEAQHGTSSYVYDRCPTCPLLYRSRFKNLDNCPRCAVRGVLSPRYKGEGASHRPAAVLVYNPISEYIRYLWQHADLAR